MVFDSIPFLVFFPTFLIVYHASHRRRPLQIAELLIASYVFYGWWDWRFLGLLVLSSVTITSSPLLWRVHAFRARERGSSWSAS